MQVTLQWKKHWAPVNVAILLYMHFEAPHLKGEVR
jgi:hypothetical protein